ncbi:MAG: hypothetical protein LBT47_03995 [Deltaproteobacteria bacterium]|jgi:putative two-component system response regulator|nr:hypothetical protein [Deltaproteobacteria bacterium]
MVEAKTKTIVKFQNKIFNAMAEMVEGCGSAAGSHIIDTKFYLRALLSSVNSAGLWPEQSSSWDVDLPAQSSQLHDVGKISIRDSVLKKPGQLTDEQYDEMKEHVRFLLGFH